jgi:hypothetical protein
MLILDVAHDLFDQVLEAGRSTPIKP